VFLARNGSLAPVQGMLVHVQTALWLPWVAKRRYDRSQCTNTVVHGSYGPAPSPFRRITTAKDTRTGKE